MKLNLRQVVILFFCFVSSVLVSAQEVDLFKLQEKEEKEKEKNTTDITTAIFKTTRIVNGHSIENIGAGLLDVKINHRFGRVNTGGYNLFGLDQASMRMGLDYG
ncbi:MAG: DUF5777 family beta-barrel protein, partial [Sediminibacterium sp.]|nr:DUF5777 family beta-barrel protein [Sediminibacterium sp.]